MAWKCPECSENNHDDVVKCYCGYGLVQTGRETTSDADLAASKRTVSDAITGAQNTSKGDVDMIGQSLFERKSRTQQWLWLDGAQIGTGLVLMVILQNMAFGGLAVWGIISLILTKKRSRKPMVIVREDHVESNYPTLQLVRYSDIQKVERPNRRRLVLVVKTDNGETRNIKIALDALEQDQGEQLAAFLSKKAATA